MIHQLTTPCWHFDSDRWEEPHFPTEAAALAHEAEHAAQTECAPRPMLGAAAGCWVADCDRCTRPLADEDDYFAEVHYSSERQLTTELDAAGWRVVAGGRLCCGGCAAASPTLANVARVPVTIRGNELVRETTGEATACPQLVVTVLRSAQQGRWLGVALTHRPTGMRLPLDAWTDQLGVLHRVAELLADLDWSSPDPGHYATGYTDPVVAAVNQACDEHATVTGVPR
ncbi:MAG: hypothetical protein GEV09_15900 [Pseudonocardiaceae bacterium]|nr:hypothetical protein [Pseudonocardiaceae bacterium]